MPTKLHPMTSHQREQLRLPSLDNRDLLSDDATKVFNSIYERHVWGAGEVGGEGSGIGSSLNYTAGVRQILGRFVERHSLTTMIDAPCGSFHWMPHVLRHFPQLNYHGFDAASDVIKKITDSQPHLRLAAGSGGDGSSSTHHRTIEFSTADLSQVQHAAYLVVDVHSSPLRDRLRSSSPSTHPPLLRPRRGATPGQEEPHLVRPFTPSPSFAVAGAAPRQRGPHLLPAPPPHPPLLQVQLPGGKDLIFSRDALQHLPYTYILGILRNFRQVVWDV